MVQNPAANARATGEVDSILGSGRSLGGGNGNPLQYSSMDRGAWWAIIHGVTELDTTEHFDIHSEYCES